MTWAEETTTSSRIAVRSDAYKAYWNFDLYGQKNLPAQIRYTHDKHDLLRLLILNLMIFVICKLQILNFLLFLSLSWE